MFAGLVGIRELEQFKAIFSEDVVEALGRNSQVLVGLHSWKLPAYRCFVFFTYQVAIREKVCLSHVYIGLVRQILSPDHLPAAPVLHEACILLRSPLSAGSRPDITEILAAPGLNPTTWPRRYDD